MLLCNNYYFVNYRLKWFIQKRWIVLFFNTFQKIFIIIREDKFGWCNLAYIGLSSMEIPLLIKNWFYELLSQVVVAYPTNLETLNHPVIIQSTNFKSYLRHIKS